ncbi:TIGR04338 family metallohydrolase [Gordonia sp. (in: high G+C Gram-positive bacteria)]|uniref:TIGR04338 family metallohydrolase n=1 Tax=Gordonia sp. (in: high G+C Gram-positive bacteria) TaxID=84139 RepID=UPI003529C672
MTRDARRARCYDAERLIFRLMERPGGGAHTVELAGTTLTLPGEARFGSVESVQRYVDDVLALPAVRERFARAARPVRVRDRRSAAASHYSRDDATIAIPAGQPDRWAMRELAVLHELAHHLDDDGVPAHGLGFTGTLTELAGLVLGPETGLVYRVILGDAGLL